MIDTRFIEFSLRGTITIEVTNNCNKTDHQIMKDIIKQLKEQIDWNLDGNTGEGYWNILQSDISGTGLNDIDIN